jgi:hypothetical protein
VKIIYAAAFLFATLARADVSTVSILPSATDPAVKTFDNPHWIYVNRDVVKHKPELPQDRHELYLFIPGTHEKGNPRGKGPFASCDFAADLGYHVVVLAYPSVTVGGSQSEGSLTAHFSMLKPKNADCWKQVWTYLLTEKTA